MQWCVKQSLKRLLPGNYLLDTSERKRPDRLVWAVLIFLTALAVVVVYRINIV